MSPVVILLNILTVQNLDFHCQVEHLTRVSIIVNTYCWNCSMKRPPHKLLTQCYMQQQKKKEVFLTTKERDAYAGPSLNWPSPLSSVHCPSCDVASIGIKHGAVCGLENFIFIEKLWLCVFFNVRITDESGCSFKLSSNIYHSIACQIARKDTTSI